MEERKSASLQVPIERRIFPQGADLRAHTVTYGPDAHRPARRPAPAAARVGVDLLSARGPCS